MDSATRAPADRAAAEYEALRESIQRANPEEVFPVVEEAYSLREKGKLEDGRRHLERFLKSHPKNPEAHFAMGLYLQQAGQLQQALEEYKIAVSIKNDYGRALNNWGVSLSLFADEQRGAQRKKLLKQSCRRPEEAAKHKRDSHEVLYNWGLSLHKLANEYDDQTQQDLLLQACTRYQEATEQHHGFYEALDNWSVALVQLAQMATGQKQVALWKKVAERQQGLRRSRLIPTTTTLLAR